MSRQQITDELALHGIALSVTSRTLPKGALAKLSKLTPLAIIEHAPAAVPSALRPAMAAADRLETPVIWTTIGREIREIEHLVVDQVLAIHEALVQDFCEGGDPIEPPGVRSIELLESAFSRPLTSLGGVRKYPSLEMAAGALFHSLIGNHPFYNGNKRTALVSLLVMLDQNNVLLTANQDELFKFALRVASHALVPPGWSERADREVRIISSWIRSNSRAIRKGERPIKWGQLRRILNGFECEMEQARKVGNRMNISRNATSRRRWLGKEKTVRLACQVWYGDEGREVDRSALSHLRRELWLDDDHGTDSEAFYGTDKRRPDEFIALYRKTLMRLARV